MTFHSTTEDLHQVERERHLEIQYMASVEEEKCAAKCSFNHLNEEERDQKLHNDIKISSTNTKIIEIHTFK